LKVFITGASSGLGAALAACYAGRGATLGLLARRHGELERVAQSLDTTTSIYAADVSDFAAMHEASADFIRRFGLPDIVIANAGISVGTSAEESSDLAVLAEILATNVTGLASTLAPFVAPMRKAGKGTLAGIASVAGFRGLPGAGAYCASKSAAITWLESLRLELRSSGVRVVTVCPGYIATPMTAANPYPMPFLLSAAAAAASIAHAIDRGDSLAVVPRPMRIAAFLLRQTPNFLYDRLFALAPRKPRRERVERS
jgi:short-subunit dehydrogenase